MSVSDLLWFHAFSRGTVGEVLDALRSGPKVRPKACRTHENEDRLGLARHVYAYVGRTLPDFGDVAFALPLDAFAGGVMSPFDTGALVKHIVPVRDWKDDARRKFLADYTWSTRNRNALLRAYPTTSRANLLAYLDGKRPSHDGPHVVWSGKTVAAIWKNTTSDDPRPWTWEGRIPEALVVAGNISAWSCTPALYEAITAHAETVTERKEKLFLDELLERYRRGGVSVLVTDLRKEQAA
jgi:hypothetical protein